MMMMVKAGTYITFSYFLTYQQFFPKIIIFSKSLFENAEKTFDFKISDADVLSGLMYTLRHKICIYFTILIDIAICILRMVKTMQIL